MVYLHRQRAGRGGECPPNAATIASMFGLEDKVDELMAGFDARIQTLADFAADKAAIVGMCTSGGFNAGQRRPLLHHRPGDRL